MVLACQTPNSDYLRQNPIGEYDTQILIDDKTLKACLEKRMTEISDSSVGIALTEASTFLKEKILIKPNL